MPTIRYGFFCEDTRLEKTGQITAVGLWGDTLHVSSFPAAIRAVAFTAYADNPESATLRFGIRLEGPFARPPGDLGELFGEIPGQVGKTGSFFGFVTGGLTFSGPGTLSATVRLTDQPDSERTFTLEIALAPAPSPTG